MIIAVHSLTSGEVLRIVWCPVAADQIGAGEGWLQLAEQISPATQYIDLQTGDVLERPALDLPEADSAGVGVPYDMDVPEGTIVRTENIEMAADEEGMTLIFDEPGSYRVRLVPPFPFQRHVLQLDAA